MGALGLGLGLGAHRRAGPTGSAHYAGTALGGFSSGKTVLSAAGQPLTDARGRRSYVTSAGAGPSVGKHLLMAYLPPEQAVAGTALRVEYLGEQYPVTVAVAGSAPLFDPANERVRR